LRLKAEGAAQRGAVAPVLWWGRLGYWTGAERKKSRCPFSRAPAHSLTYLASREPSYMSEFSSAALDMVSLAKMICSMRPLSCPTNGLK
jgi:hypothetical protein